VGLYRQSVVHNPIAFEKPISGHPGAIPKLYVVKNYKNAAGLHELKVSDVGKKVGLHDSDSTIGIHLFYSGGQATVVGRHLLCSCSSTLF
jgi:hypothetical protein